MTTIARKRTEKSLSNGFLAVFAFLLLAGPCTHLLFIVNPDLHYKLGLSEALIMDPEYGWFQADELAIAWADMTCLIAGAAFLVGARFHCSWCIPFGFYTCSCWYFIMLMARIRWPLLESNGFGVMDDSQRTMYHVYAYMYIGFGWCGMYYLWSNRRIFDK